MIERVLIAASSCSKPQSLWRRMITPPLASIDASLVRTRFV